MIIEGLKPCPFCGEKDFLIEGGTFFEHFAVTCINCGGRIGYFDTKEEAIAAWNRRIRDED